MGKLKLVHVTYLFHPEMGYDVNHFARFVSPEVDMTILTSDKLDLWKTDAAQIAQKDRVFEQQYGVIVKRLPSFKTGAKKAGVFIKGLNSEIERINPDILFVHGIESPTYAHMLWKQSGRRYLASDTHTLFGQFADLSLPGKLYLKGLFMPLLVKKMVRNAYPAFYTARENKKVLQWFGIPEHLIHSNEICTDTAMFRKVEINPDELIKGLLPGGKMLLYTGKFDHFKQPELLVEAVRLVEKQIDCPLNIVFVGPENKSYAAEKLLLPFENPNIKVLVLPAVPNHQLNQYYSVADVAVFPRQNTLSSLDAQACGLPVIMEEDETNAERLEKGGLCYRSGDKQHLAEQILLLLKNNELRDSLAETGAAYMRERYDYSKKMADIQQWLIEDFRKSRFSKNRVTS
jgi:glycosyltransferase involved in cell wall biosynthesis